MIQSATEGLQANPTGTALERVYFILQNLNGFQVIYELGTLFHALAMSMDRYNAPIHQLYQTTFPLPADCLDIIERVYTAFATFYANADTDNPEPMIVEIHASIKAIFDLNATLQFTVPHPPVDVLRQYLSPGNNNNTRNLLWRYATHPVHKSWIRPLLGDLTCGNNNRPIISSLMDIEQNIANEAVVQAELEALLVIINEIDPATIMSVDNLMTLLQDYRNESGTAPYRQEPQSLQDFERNIERTQSRATVRDRGHCTLNIDSPEIQNTLHETEILCLLNEAKAPSILPLTPPLTAHSVAVTEVTNGALFSLIAGKASACKTSKLTFTGTLAVDAGGLSRQFFMQAGEHLIFGLTLANLLP